MKTSYVMRRIVLYLGVLAIASGAMAQSQEPRPPIREQLQAQPNTDQLSSPSPQRTQPPIIVNVQPPPKTEAERAEEAHDRQEKSDLDRQLVKFTAGLYYATFALAVATILLVVVTGGLAAFAFVQARDMKASVAAAKDAAIAAQRSAAIAEDALVTTERAFVFLDDFTTEFMTALRGSGDNNLTFTNFTIKPRWHNSGNTPTRNMVISINWTPWWNDDLPTEFLYQYGEEEGYRPVRMFLGPKAYEWSAAIVIPPNVATDALNGKQHIFIWGRVNYEDIFDGSRAHFTHWCYRLVFTKRAGNVGTQFVAFGDYNSSDEDSREKQPRGQSAGGNPT